MNYALYDLKVTTTGDQTEFNCSHKTGESIIFEGEDMKFGPGTTQFSHYALATLMPYVAAKQRAKDKNDWMYFESEIACPDPRCEAVFKFERLRRKIYQYS